METVEIPSRAPRLDPSSFYTLEDLLSRQSPPRERTTGAATELPQPIIPRSASPDTLCSIGDASDFDVVPRELLIPPDLPIRGFSRGDAGVVLDRELVKLAGMDHRCRIIQARLARRLMQSRAWRPLGFVRLSDYARESLGCSPRALEDDARVLTALDALPRICAALETGVLSWTQTRLLVRVATAEREDELLDRAATLTTRELESFVRTSAAKPDECAAESAGTQSDPGQATSSGARWDSDATPFSSDLPTDKDTGEPLVRWSTRVSPTGLRQWRCVREVASRAAGMPLSSAQVLELVVAEASAGQPDDAADPPGWTPGTERIEQRLLEQRRHDDERSRQLLEAFRAEVGVVEGFAWLDPANREAGPAERLDGLLDSLDSIDAVELDRRLREVRQVTQRIDYQLGALVRIGADRRLFREIGFATVKLYVESRFGCSARRIWSLLAIERESWRHGDALRKAWSEGRLSHLAASTLLPVIGEHHGEAWIRRAGEVTLRRLADEVAWALDHGDRESPTSRPAPPPPHADVRPGGLSSVDLHEVQMRAHGESSKDEFGAPGGSRLSFLVPVSVAVLLETQLWRYRHRGDPDWRSFERVVAHALLEWTSVPKHRDPVFERDGWRCAVPGCTSRRNLHVHHVVFRSLGGDNSRGNRVTVCAAHHLHGIHAGIVRAEGKAPEDLIWELGCSAGRKPFMRLHGERFFQQAA